MNTVLIDDLWKLGAALLVGSIIGLEREYQYKAAGFRTIILITLGSALYTIISTHIDPAHDKTRIAANIITGIGFLGAGTILREGGRITGLTTAATIWIAAALGMGAGAGELTFTAMATLMTLIVLLFFPRIGALIDRLREARTYTIVIVSGNVQKTEKIAQAFKTCHIRIAEQHVEKVGRRIKSSWRTIGLPKNHEKFLKTLSRDRKSVV